MRKVLLIGAGYVAGPTLDYLLRRDDNTVTVGVAEHHVSSSIINYSMRRSKK